MKYIKLTVIVAHAAAVVGAFIWTLDALHLNATVSGPEYWYQIVLALPWSILPIGGFGYRTDAIVLLILGWLNTAILCRHLLRNDSNRTQIL